MLPTSSIMIHAGKYAFLPCAYIHTYTYNTCTRMNIHIPIYIYIYIAGAVIHKTLIRRSYDRTAVWKLSECAGMRGTCIFTLPRVNAIHTHTHRVCLPRLFHSHIASSLHLIKAQNAFFAAKGARSAHDIDSRRKEGGKGRRRLPIYFAPAVFNLEREGERKRHGLTLTGRRTDLFARIYRVTYSHVHRCP